MVRPLSVKFTTPITVTVASTPRPAFLDNIPENLAAVSNVYYTPLLIFLGTVGNLISIFVFYKTKLRLQSTSLYLSALAISDTIFLLQLLPPWLNAIELTNIFHRNGFCQFFVYVSYVTCSLSAWLVVAFTVERFVAVIYPLRRNVVCTAARARIVILMLVVIALTLNIPVIKFASPSSNDCNLDYDYVKHAARFNIVDTALSFTLPLVVIVLLNTWIMVGVYQIGRARRQLLKANAGRRLVRGLRNAAPPTPPRSQHRVTKMLVTVSSVFVLLNMPAYSMRILSYTYDKDADEYSNHWAAFTQLAIMFFNTNFGINFILYCLIGQNFRRSLCQSIPCTRNRSRRAAAVRRTSFHPARASSGSTSFVSGTDVNSNYATCLNNVTSGNNVRRHRSDPVIQRWTFDNSRQRASASHSRANDIEMAVFSPTNYSNPMVSRNEPATRTVPFLLFPYRNLIVPRHRDRMVIESPMNH